MEAHQIIDETMERGEAIQMAKLFGKTADYWNSFRRAPRSPENPFGTGNYSPVHNYLQFIRMRMAINKAGALRMHRLVTDEVEGDLEVPAGVEEFNALSMSILRQATEAISMMNDAEARRVSDDYLRALDKALGKLSSEVDITRGHVRRELRRRDTGGKVFESFQ